MNPIDGVLLLALISTGTWLALLIATPLARVIEWALERKRNRTYED